MPRKDEPWATGFKGRDRSHRNKVQHGSIRLSIRKNFLPVSAGPAANGLPQIHLSGIGEGLLFRLEPREAPLSFRALSTDCSALPR